MSGSYFGPIKRIFLNLSGGTVTGDTVFTEGVYATELSGGTIYSGSTLLDSIIVSIASSIISSSASTLATYVQPGSNIITGGTVGSPIVSTVSSPSFDSIFFSGTAIGSALSATTLSGGTLYSGSTNLYSIFSTTDTNDITRVQPGSNITTGGTANEPIVSLVDSPSFNGLSLSGAGNFAEVVATSLSATTISGGTLYSGSTNLYSIFSPIGGGQSTYVQPGSNITTGGTVGSPIISVVVSPSFNDLSFSGIAIGGAVNATSLSATSLTDTRVLFAGANGLIKDDSNLTFNSSTDTLSTKYIIIGAPGQTGTTATIYGDVLVVGEAISGFTSELFVEDNFIELNYNPTASTASTSLGAGWAIQDGSGSAGTDVFLDIRGASVGLSNRGFATNLNDIYIRESGTTSSPGGVRVIAENDTLDGGLY